jgi:HSP20 family protein
MNCGVTKYDSRPTIIPISRLFESLFSDPRVAITEASVEEGALAVDVSEDPRSVIVRASLPGFTKDNVDVEVHDGVLTIKATQSEQREEKGERFYRKERRFGSVSRRIALPCAVQDAEAKADLTDGVLTLRLPKSQKDSPRKVSIN